MLKKSDYALLISLLTLLAFLILFLFRAIDDNRLTSWQWVFASVDPAKIYIILIIGIFLAYGISRVSFENPIFLFLSSFIIAAVFWREPEVIVDVSRYFTQAKHLEIYGIGYFFREWGKDIMVWTDMPLVPFLYGLIFKFLGESRIYIQVFTTLLFSMTVVLTYLIGKTLWNKDFGFYAGILLLGIPYLLTQVPLMLVDVPTMFFLTLSIFLFIKALQSGGLWVVFSSIAIFLTFYSKYSTWLMLSILAVIFIIHLKTALHNHRVTVYRASIITLTSGLLIGVIFLYKSDVLSEQIKLLLSYQMPGLRRWEESFISTFFFQIHPFITIASLYSAYVAFKRRNLKYAIIIWLVLLVVLLQVKRIRYIIMVLPMLSLMASYGLQGIKENELRRFVVSCIVISSLVIAIFAYLPFLQKISTVNLKYAGKFLNSIEAESIEVFTLSQKDHILNPAVSVPLLDIYTDKGIEYLMMQVLLTSSIEESPLRFTWEYKNPEYYALSNEDSKKAIVVIANGLNQILPNHIEQKTKRYKNFKVFKTSEDIFQYKTIVTVYYN